MAPDRPARDRRTGLARRGDEHRDWPRRDRAVRAGRDLGPRLAGPIRGSAGTLRYMAPERFRGEGDARADIYALGLTLYELLTLRPAYSSADRLRLIEQIKSEEPPRPRSVDGRIPRDLETVVLKAIEKAPER